MKIDVSCDSDVTQFEKDCNKRIKELENHNHKIIDIKYAFTDKYFTAMILYEKISIKNELSKQIKDFIEQTIHNELKDIREIYNDFHNLVKEIKKD
jgi:hypothetical protein